ncbi:hypothetical protein [Coraliomargarita parva]|uniref:hypothetical protein n=1 Tax=Coraliomargarita parva TaxID=3014050 RepID=UPI0022B2D566|nr:hypothetical protein [Coraliomargarita parva]
MKTSHNRDSVRALRLGRRGFMAIAFALTIQSCTCLLSHGDLLAARMDEPSFLEFRSYLKIGNEARFSIHDTETGTAYWLSEGQGRGRLHVDTFDPQAMELTVHFEKDAYTLKLVTPDRSSFSITTSVGEADKDLSPFNQKLLRTYMDLLKPTYSSESKRMLIDQRIATKLRAFILGNPSPTELTEFLYPTHQNDIDFKKFLELELPTGIESRNKSNTPGWEIKDSISLKDIEQLIASNPSTEELEKIKKAQYQNTY